MANVDERTALLTDTQSHDAHDHDSANLAPRRDVLSSSPSPSRKRAVTPLPMMQIWVVIILQVVEPITSQSIYPYINQLVRELDITGGDEKRVGYYAGLIESLFFFTESLTVLHYSRLSDSIGRKPVLLLGLFGTTVSMLAFGFSRTFWALVVSRCLTGLLNGNIGVMKSVMGDLTDASNRAQGTAMMPVVWGFGATMGPLIGGTFARPHGRLPGFDGDFWVRYPYLLPCIISGACAFLGFLLCLFVFKESAPHKRQAHRLSASYSSIETVAPKPLAKPVPLSVIVRSPRVILAVSNYVALAFLNIAFNALFPLFLASAPLHFPPSTIGYAMGTYGCLCGLYQYFAFAYVIRNVGERSVFVWGIGVYPFVFALFPLISISASAERWGLVWLGIALIILGLVLQDMAFGAIFMYVTTSAPNSASLGATNGLSQTVVSVARALGPACATSLWSVCQEIGGMWRWAVYVGFAMLGVLAVGLAKQLPEGTWSDDEDEDESR